MRFLDEPETCFWLQIFDYKQECKKNPKLIQVAERNTKNVLWVPFKCCS